MSNHFPLETLKDRNLLNMQIHVHLKEHFQALNLYELHCQHVDILKLQIFKLLYILFILLQISYYCIGDHKDFPLLHILRKNKSYNRFERHNPWSIQMDYQLKTIYPFHFQYSIFSSYQLRHLYLFISQHTTLNFSS